MFGHRFLSEEPIFQELIQAINFGLAFVNTMWRRVIGIWEADVQAMGWLGPKSGRGLSQGLIGRVPSRQEGRLWGPMLGSLGSFFSAS